MIARARTVLSGGDEWTEEGFANLVNGIQSECPRLKGMVESIWEHSLRDHKIKNGTSNNDLDAIAESCAFSETSGPRSAPNDEYRSNS